MATATETKPAPNVEKAPPLEQFSFETISPADLPKTTREPSEEDRKTSAALLAAVASGNAVRSTSTFPTREAAEKIGGKMRRALSRVAPDGKTARARVIREGDNAWRWVVLLGTPIARAKRK